MRAWFGSRSAQPFCSGFLKLNAGKDGHAPCLGRGGGSVFFFLAEMGPRGFLEVLMDILNNSWIRAVYISVSTAKKRLKGHKTHIIAADLEFHLNQ
jgi:hypothetical protein